jgi:hypothetical protein
MNRHWRVKIFSCKWPLFLLCVGVTWVYVGLTPAEECGFNSRVEPGLPHLHVVMGALWDYHNFS